jgi:tetratricopeptide (TPR) repeat protein
MGLVFERFFPEPPPLKLGQKWHIFVSYRSTDRRWVLKLYDALRHLKYSVFVDQYVLNAAAPLAKSLNEGLAKSASAIMVWSKNYQTSQWTENEYNALEAILAQRQDFAFGTATLDSTPLPPIPAGRIYMDFSQQLEGPCGLPLLRLLLGMMGKPLPDDAIAAADAIDTERKRYLALIKAARQNDTPNRIVELAAAEGAAWLDSPILGCASVEALIAAEKFDAAVKLLDRTRELFPEAIRPRQLQGLVARRQGNWERALEIFGAMYAEDFKDPETIGMYASAWWSRYRESGNKLHLMKSRDLYREAFEISPTDYYTGINAASKSLFLGERETAQQLAVRVVDLFSQTPKDYWGLASLGEAKLLLEDYDSARQYYLDAVLAAPGETGSQASTRDQALAIMNALTTPQAGRNQIEQVFSHLRAAATGV